MKLEQATNQLSLINEVLARSEYYRGFQSLPSFISGCAGLTAAVIQNHIIGETPSPRAFVYYWAAVAMINMIMFGIFLMYGYLSKTIPSQPGRTKTVLIQFAPCIAAGLLLAIYTVRADSGFVRYLPGLWALLFGMGIFSIRPYQPKIVSLVAAFYFFGGGALLALSFKDQSLHPFGLGLVFGIGQIISACVLYWSMERKKDER